MPVSRRLRFEILRRDRHTCRYCGATAPDVVLTVDHVIPTALGGGDEPGNLVAACSGCNSGKSSVPADAPTVAEVGRDAIRWSKAMKEAAEYYRLDREAVDAEVAVVDTHWRSWRSGQDPLPRPPNWRDTIERLLENGLPSGEMVRLTDVSMKSHVQTYDKWRYFCGCCWRVLSEIQEIAREIADTESRMETDS